MLPNYRHRIYDMARASDVEALERLRASGEPLITIDTYATQARDLIKARFPGKKFEEKELDSMIGMERVEKSLFHQGSWIHYPWRRELVHLLSKEDFISLRTNRNKNKITQQEQDSLAGKKIGLVGLSVGHAVAHTLAMERLCGELRIADFDVLDLSNLNRIRSSVANIGIPKTVITAREIAELDPYLTVSPYHDGVTEANVDEFIEGLDLIIDECDSLDIKILLREKAKAAGIPVIMATSDRGMLDIERFDLIPELPLMHGLVSDLDSAMLKDLTNEEKIPYVLSMLEFDKVSTALKESMAEIGKSLSTWPQLASDVIQGGGCVAAASRLILLGADVSSGRYLIDAQEELTDQLVTSMK